MQKTTQCSCSVGIAVAEMAAVLTPIGHMARGFGVVSWMMPYARSAAILVAVALDHRRLGKHQNRGVSAILTKT